MRHTTPWQPSFEDVYRAYLACRYGKKRRNQQLLFEHNLGSNILALTHELASRRYIPRPVEVFTVYRPRPREIIAPHFRDRIVHHLLVKKLEPLWEQRFSYTSFSCRRGKGQHAALRYFVKKVQKISQGGRRLVWVLQLDVERFFATIHRPTLVNLLLGNVEDSFLRYLISTLYLHDARKGAWSRGPGPRGGSPHSRSGEIAGYPTAATAAFLQEKSWFRSSEQTGLPIGSLTSQFGANVYLHGLDQFIARALKPAASLRYTDDLTLLGPDPKELWDMHKPIEEWLKTRRIQTLNKNKLKLTRLDHGIEYLGYRLFQDLSTAGRVRIALPRNKMSQFVLACRSLERGGLQPPRLFDFPAPLVSLRKAREQLCSINSRLGHLRFARTWRLRSHVLVRLQHVLSERHASHYLILLRHAFASIRIRLKLGSLHS